MKKSLYTGKMWQALALQFARNVSKETHQFQHAALIQHDTQWKDSEGNWVRAEDFNAKERLIEGVGCEALVDLHLSHNHNSRTQEEGDSPELLEEHITQRYSDGETFIKFALRNYLDIEKKNIKCSRFILPLFYDFNPDIFTMQDTYLLVFKWNGLETDKAIIKAVNLGEFMKRALSGLPNSE